MPSNEVALSWWTFYIIFSYPSVTKVGRIRTFFLFEEVEPDMREQFFFKWKAKIVVQRIHQT